MHANLKLKSLDEIRQQVTHLKQQQKKVGLIAGCFDIIHIGHIDLFREAKKHADILIIQLENDENTRTLKGEDRPIHNFLQRAGVLSELISVDYIYKVEKVFTKNSKEAEEYYANLVLQINPDYIFTTPKVDNYLTQKKQNAKKSNSQIIEVQYENPTSTTNILSKLKQHEN
jgi:D-beta-D-heptose 7-phosphate kinase/D-beta-D-heptose 1-phosphate adenosyltransferase